MCWHEVVARATDYPAATCSPRCRQINPDAPNTNVSWRLNGIVGANDVTVRVAGRIELALTRQTKDQQRVEGGNQGLDSCEQQKFKRHCSWPASELVGGREAFWPTAADRKAFRPPVPGANKSLPGRLALSRRCSTTDGLHERRCQSFVTSASTTTVGKWSHGGRYITSRVATARHTNGNSASSCSSTLFNHSCEPVTPLGALQTKLFISETAWTTDR